MTQEYGLRNRTKMACRLAHGAVTARCGFFSRTAPISVGYVWQISLIGSVLKTANRRPPPSPEAGQNTLVLRARPLFLTETLLTLRASPAVRIDLADRSCATRSIVVPRLRLHWPLP